MIAKLTDPWFEARFYAEVTASSYRTHRGDGTPYTFADAQGVMLWCPCGYGKPEYPIDGGRPHAILVPFSDRGVLESHGPVSRDGTHPRWSASGSSLTDLTCAPSIAVDSPECWHGFITNGIVT